MSEPIRLQKVLAAAGVASRRASEKLIEQRRVQVNGQVVTEQGTRVDPARDEIRVDGSRIPVPNQHRYLVLNKPRGVVCTMSDPQGRPDLTQYVPAGRQRLFHVGRLDTDTEGLLLLTNDGELAHRLAHPSYEVSKTYVVVVPGAIEQGAVQQLRRGVLLDDGPVRPDAISVTSRAGGKSMLKVTLHEGRNRIVRRMFDAVGYPVQRLARIAIGPVTLGQLPVGKTRDLSRKELGELLDLVGL